MIHQILNLLCNILVTGPLIVRYQNLLQSVRIKSDIAQPGKRICDLYEEGECLSVVSVIAIAWRLSKFLSLLHESCVSIKRLTADDIYVKFHKQVSWWLLFFFHATAEACIYKYVSIDRHILHILVYRLAERRQ